MTHSRNAFDYHTAWSQQTDCLEMGGCIEFGADPVGTALSSIPGLRIPTDLRWVATVFRAFRRVQKVNGVQGSVVRRGGGYLAVVRYGFANFVSLMCLDAGLCGREHGPLFSNQCDAQALLAGKLEQLHAAPDRDRYDRS